MRQLQEALQDYEAAAALLRESRNASEEGVALEHAAQVLLLLKRVDEAVEHYVQAGHCLARGGVSHQINTHEVLYHGFREALRAQRWAAAQRALQAFRELGAPELRLAHLQAQLLGQSDAPGADEAYTGLLAQSQPLPPDMREHFRLVVEAGRLRQRQRAAFGGCPGAVVVRRASLKESEESLLHGDILLPFRGQCVHSAEYLRPMLEASQIEPLNELTVLRNGAPRTLTLPKPAIRVEVSPF